MNLGRPTGPEMEAAILAAVQQHRIDRIDARYLEIGERLWYGLVAHLSHTRFAWAHLTPDSTEWCGLRVVRVPWDACVVRDRDGLTLRDHRRLAELNEPPDWRPAETLPEDFDAL